MLWIRHPRQFNPPKHNHLSPARVSSAAFGGLRVPLADGREVVDLVADLGVPAVVVSRSGLGTLNHTALTVEALERRDVEVRGVVLNEYEGATRAERTNPSVMERQTGHDVATLPPADLADPAAAVDLVADLPRYTGG